MAVTQALSVPIYYVIYDYNQRAKFIDSTLPQVSLTTNVAFKKMIAEPTTWSMTRLVVGAQVAMDGFLLSLPP